MHTDFELADIKNNQEVINKLTQFENEMGREIGGDIVLIAYKRDDQENND